MTKKLLGSWMTASLGGVFVVFAVLRSSGLDDRFPSAIGRAPYYGVYFGATALVGARVVMVKRRRLAWAVLAVGFAIYNLATVYYTAVLAKQDPVPFPNLADAGWIALYPFAYLAILLLIRAQTGRITARTWIDGAISVLGSGAAMSALVMGLLVEASVGGTLGLATGLAYPTGDVLLVGLALGSILFMSGRPTPSWLMLTSGLVFFAMSDIAYVTMLSHGTYESGNFLDLGWAAGVAFIGVSAWRRDQGHEAVSQRSGLLTIALPMFFAISSLTVVSVAAFAEIPVAAIFLAVATLILVIARIALSFRDALALGQAQGEARTDDLTGLGNRRALYEYLSRVIEERDHEAQIAVLLLDLDNFKEVNDSFGHQAGDRILERIGPRMQSALREGDFLARLGGDEFVVVLHSDLQRAVVVAQRLRAELIRPFEVDDLPTTLDASIGIALCPRDAERADRLLQQADIAMYAAKEARSGHQIYETGTDIDTRMRTETIQKLRRDVATEAMVLHYQPKIELPSEAIVGVEALVRWDHPIRGLVYPDHFLPLVEQAGLMKSLTKNVLNSAIQQCSRWRDEGLDLTMSVNLSPCDLRTDGFPRWVKQTLAQAGLPSHRLRLELTEGILMTDPERSRQVLEQLRDIGVGISIDDFGTGHSSLSYLQDLPVDELKLDRSFVMRLDGKDNSAPIVKSTIELAHSLGIKLVAEGVESPATLEQLAIWECDLAQGHHISRPRPPHQLTPWLHNRLNNRPAKNTITAS